MRHVQSDRGEDLPLRGCPSFRVKADVIAGFRVRAIEKTRVEPFGSEFGPIRSQPFFKLTSRPPNRNGFGLELFLGLTFRQSHRMEAVFGEVDAFSIIEWDRPNSKYLPRLFVPHT